MGCATGASLPTLSCETATLTLPLTSSQAFDTACSGGLDVVRLDPACAVCRAEELTTSHVLQNQYCSTAAETCCGASLSSLSLSPSPSLPLSLPLPFPLPFRSPLSPSRTRL